ncbi:hypothetical protein Tco_0775555 [Tanacetum coccineum]
MKPWSILSRERRRQLRNEEVRAELEYSNEEPRGSVVEFEDAPNREGSRAEREFDGRRPSERKLEGNGSHGGNLPPFLAAHLRMSENEQPL